VEQGVKPIVGNTGDGIPARIGDVMRNSLSERYRCEKPLRSLYVIYFNVDMEK